LNAPKRTRTAVWALRGLLPGPQDDGGFGAITGIDKVLHPPGWLGSDSQAAPVEFLPPKRIEDASGTCVWMHLPSQGEARDIENRRDFRRFFQGPQFGYISSTGEKKKKNETVFTCPTVCTQRLSVKESLASGSGYRGGIGNGQSSENSALVIMNVTIAGNGASQVGGGLNYRSGNVNISNTILANKSRETCTSGQIGNCTSIYNLSTVPV